MFTSMVQQLRLSRLATVKQCMYRKVLSLILFTVSLNCICCYLMSLIHCKGLLRVIKPRSNSIQSIGRTQYFSKHIRNTALKCLDTDSQIICNDIESSVWNSLYKNVFSEANEEVKCLLTVSGGSDSVAMMHILQAIKDSYKVNLSLEVINFNHKARPESDEEAQFVISLATKYEIPYHVLELPEKLRVKSGFQEVARDWRRRECERILTEQAHSGPVFICTAHNSDDQNETMMLKLLRGVHLSNFQPMKILDGKYFRPVLHLSKQQIEDYLTRRGLEWRVDSSNESREYKRNQVRLDLLPLMEQLAGGKAALSTRFAQLAQQSEDLKDWIDSECLKYDNVFRLNFRPDEKFTYFAKMTFQKDYLVAKIPKLVLSELVRRWVQRGADLELGAEAVQRITESLCTPLGDGRAKRTVTISKEWEVSRYRNELRLEQRVVPDRHRDRT